MPLSFKKAIIEPVNVITIDAQVTFLSDLQAHITSNSKLNASGFKS